MRVRQVKSVLRGLPWSVNQTQHAGVILSPDRINPPCLGVVPRSFVQNFLSRLGVVTTLDFAVFFDSVFVGLFLQIGCMWILILRWRSGSIPGAVPV